MMAVLGGVVSAHAPVRAGHKILYAVAFLVLGVGAIVFAVKLSREQAEAATTMTATVAKLTLAATQTERLQEMNAAQNQQIIDLSRLNAGLAQKGIFTVTGGDSYCTMHLLFQFNPPVPTFGNLGKYPLYGVVARIVDVSKLRREVLAGKPADFSSGLVIPIGDIAKGLSSVQQSIAITISEQYFQRYNIFFSARNGVWSESMMLKKVGAEWRAAIRVTGFGLSQKVLYEQVDKIYPRNADGSVNWEEEDWKP